MSELSEKSNPYAEGIEHVSLSEDKKSVRYLDQTQLPNREFYKNADTLEECFDAIKKLEIRGAPCIGIFAGYAMYVLAKQYADCGVDTFIENMQKTAETLNSSRPTAVNLSWALKRMMNLIEEHISEGVPAIIDQIGRAHV